jgi:hypothetical protein
MDPISFVSSTPDLSRVSGASRITKPFQRFTGMREAVEIAVNSLGVASVWLESGVTESGTFLRR